MNETAQLAEHLDDHDEELIARWRDLVRQEGDVPEADDLTAVEFRDHAPQLLARVVARLRGVDSGSEGPAREHGRVRWRQGYDIHAVAIELGHLRTALRRAALEHARQHGLGLDSLEGALDAIDEVLDEATAESVQQFQEDSLGQSRRLLADSVERREEAERALRLADLEQSKLRTILDTLPVCVWVIDANGEIVGLNDEATASGATSPPTAGKNVLADGGTGEAFLIRQPNGDPFAPGELPAARALRGETVRQTYMVWETNQGLRDLMVNAAPLRSPDGSTVYGAVVVAEDVTDARHLETALALVTAQLQTLVDRSPVMLWRSDSEGRREYLNQTWLEFRGRSAEQEHGHGWIDGVHPDDRPQVDRSRVESLECEAAFEIAYRLGRGDGEYRWITDRGLPYHDASGRFLGHLGSAFDITTRIELEQELVKQQAIAEEASRHKTRLLRTLSHDARTPLNAVVLSAELLEMHAQDTSDPEVVECLRTIRHSVRNVLDLLNDLLDLTRIDSGALPPEISRFELVPALEECVASVEPQARQKGLAIRIEVAELVGLQIDTDRAKLKQILGNLLSNALRYTERGSIRVTGELTRQWLKIAVEDTGVGIEPTDQDGIFDEFAMLKRGGDGAGTGLGLAICRRLASLLRGEILLRSRPGDGSEFTLALPAETVSLALERVEASVPSRRDSGPASGLTVLLAEDHKDSRAALSRLLRRFGYRVVEAENGREAVALARVERPSAVFMDVVMPVMDGVEAMESLRDDPSLNGMPVYALTGDLAPETRVRLAKAGFRDWLAKPVDLDQIRRVLAEIAMQSDSVA